MRTSFFLAIDICLGIVNNSEALRHSQATVAELADAHA